MSDAVIVVSADTMEDALIEARRDADRETGIAREERDTCVRLAVEFLCMIAEIADDGAEIVTDLSRLDGSDDVRVGQSFFLQIIEGEVDASEILVVFADVAEKIGELHGLA